MRRSVVVPLEIDPEDNIKNKYNENQREWTYIGCHMFDILVVDRMIVPIPNKSLAIFVDHWQEKGV